jgi:quinol monooxygenase YgiN
MSSAVVLAVEYVVKPGALDQFRRAVTAMAGLSKAEDGMLTHEVYASEDGYSGLINERCANSVGR